MFVLICLFTIFTEVLSQEEAAPGCFCKETRVSNSLIVAPICTARWNREGAWCYVEPSLQCSHVYVDTLVQGAFWAFCEEADTSTATPTPTSSSPTSAPTKQECDGSRDICSNHGFYMERSFDAGCYCACDAQWTGRHCDRNVVYECPEGRIELGGAMISTPSMEHNELVTTLCPPGFLGNVQFLCIDSTVSVYYGTCVRDLFSRTPSEKPTERPSEIPTRLPTPVPSDSTTIDVLLNADSEKSANMDSDLSTDESEESVQSMQNHFMYAAILAGVLMMVLCLFLVWCCIYRIHPMYEDKSSHGLEYIISRSVHTKATNAKLERKDSPMFISYVSTEEDIAPSSVDIQVAPPEMMSLPKPQVLEPPSSPNNLMSSRSTSISRPPYASVSSTPLKKKQMFSDNSGQFVDSSSNFSVTSSSHDRSRSRQRHRENHIQPSHRRFKRHWGANSSDFPKNAKPSTFEDGIYSSEDHIFLSPIRESAENELDGRSEISEDEADLYIHRPPEDILMKPQAHRRGETPSQSREGRISISISEEGSITTSTRSVSKVRYEIHESIHQNKRHIRRVVPRARRYAKPPAPPRVVGSAPA